MAALTHGTRSALVAPTSSRPSAPAAKLPLGAAAFRAGLSTRQPSRNERVQKIVRQGLMFDDEDEEEEEYIPEYPNPRFIAETLEAFPNAAVANAEQARVLFTEGGYTYLDVRPSIEYEDLGKVKGSVNIPIVNATRKYDPEQKKKVTTKSPNEQWMQQVEKKFPKKDTKLLVGCSNGTQYCLDALGELDEAGYENIVGLKGGFYAWFSVWDNKLGRRRTGEYAETYMHDGDSCGIHSSGAGFDRVDKADKWVPPEY